MSEEDKIHGNSKESEKEQHVYGIYDTDEKLFAKYGLSGSELNKDGTSKRANQQVSKLNKMFGSIRYIAIILYTGLKGRLLGLKKEKDMVNDFAKEHGGDNPPLQILPKNDILKKQ